MLAKIKKCADEGNIKGLRYIFVDCLDVDPTFEKYKEGYEYCKNIPEFFDVHEELNALSEDSERWTQTYWDQLRIDLLKNFSQKRFEHAIAVAKVVHADKVSRLVCERKEASASFQRECERKRENESLRNQQNSAEIRAVNPGKQSKTLAEEKRIEEMKKALEKENKAFEEEEKRKEAEYQYKKRGGQVQRSVKVSSKKWLGIVITVAIIVLVLMILVLNNNSR